MPKSRPPRNAYERQLLADWEQAIRKHSLPLERGALAKGVVVGVVNRSEPVPTLTKGTRQDSDLYQHRSKSTEGGQVAGKKEVPQYSGTKMLGISVLHKSNGIPVFSNEEIIDVARMRR